MPSRSAPVVGGSASAYLLSGVPFLRVGCGSELVAWFRCSLKGSRIGSFVWIFPFVVLTNDPHPPSEHLRGVTVGDYAVIATMTVVLPGVTVGEHAVVGAGSIVARDVDPGTLVAGNPARPRGPASEVKLRDGSGESAYPWPRHFHRGYPQEVVEAWRKRFG